MRIVEARNILMALEQEGIEEFHLLGDTQLDEGSTLVRVSVKRGDDEITHQVVIFPDSSVRENRLDYRYLARALWEAQSL